MGVKKIFNRRSKNFDAIVIESLAVTGRIGTTPEERAHPQTLTISVRLACDLARAGRSDDLSDTVDYADLTERIRRLLGNREFKLVESVAEEVAAIALGFPLVKNVLVEVRKKPFADTEAVGVVVHRSRAI